MPVSTQVYKWVLPNFMLGVTLRWTSITSKGIYRVRTGPGKPGKSWNFVVAFSRTGKSWKKVTGPGTFWKSGNNSSKKI